MPTQFVEAWSEPIRLTVPSGYKHCDRIGSWYWKNRPHFRNFDRNVFEPRVMKDPLCIMTPGRHFEVRAFMCVSGDEITPYEDWLLFLNTRSALHTGLQGLSLFYELHTKMFARNHWHTCLNGLELRDSRFPALFTPNDGWELRLEFQPVDDFPPATLLLGFFEPQSD